MQVIYESHNYVSSFFCVIFNIVIVSLKGLVFLPTIPITHYIDYLHNKFVPLTHYN